MDHFFYCLIPCPVPQVNPVKGNGSTRAVGTVAAVDKIRLPRGVSRDLQEHCRLTPVVFHKKDAGITAYCIKSRIASVIISGASIGDSWPESTTFIVARGSASAIFNACDRGNWMS